MEFNQDCHLRNLDQIFLIQTESNGICSAKHLNFGDYDDNAPTIVLQNASKDLEKDVWVMEGNTNDALEVTLTSIYKSSTDDFLQCQSIDCSSFDGTQESLKRLV